MNVLWSEDMLTNGLRVLFNDNTDTENGKYGIIIGHLPRIRRDDLINYRVQIIGTQQIITATIDQFNIIGGGSTSGNTVKAKARPYGS